MESSLILIEMSGNFSICLIRYNFIKLLQTVTVKAEVQKLKVTLCKHLWLRQSSFCDIFFRHRVMFTTCPMTESRKYKSSHNRIFLSNNITFSKYFRSLHIYGPFWVQDLSSGNRKSSGNIGLLEEKNSFNMSFLRVMKVCIA